MDKPSVNTEIDFDKLEVLLKAATTDDKLYQTIVNAPFDNFGPELAKLFLGVIILLLVNRSKGTIDRIAITANDFANRAERKSKKRFKDITIPLHHARNIVAKAIDTGQPQGTDDWGLIFVPELTAEQSRINQADSGIAYSMVYPLKSNKDSGAMIFSFYQYPDKIGPAQKKFMRKYSEIVARVMS